MDRKDFPEDADGDAIWRIVSHGSDLSKPMKVDFAVAVPDDERKEKIKEIAEDHGFTTDLSQDEEDDAWTCYCSREMILNYDSLIETQKLLDQLAMPHGGFSDGWGTFGNKGANK